MDSHWTGWGLFRYFSNFFLFSAFPWHPTRGRAEDHRLMSSPSQLWLLPGCQDWT